MPCIRARRDGSCWYGGYHYDAVTLARSLAPDPRSLRSRMLLCHRPSCAHNLQMYSAPPLHASPASNLIHLSTLPGSIQRYLLHPSFGSKSPIPLIFSSHPFHTVTFCRLSLVIVNLVFPFSLISSGVCWPASCVFGVYTRSVSPEKESEEEDSSKDLALRTLSMYCELWRPWTVVLVMSWARQQIWCRSIIG